MLDPETAARGSSRPTTGARLAISLRPEDYAGPEAFSADTGDGVIVAE